MPIPSPKRKINGTLFRKKINQASSKYIKARQENKRAKKIKNGITSYNIEKNSAERSAKLELNHEVISRKKGIRGLIRVVAGKKAMKKVVAIKKYKKENSLKKDLTKIHPILKGIKITDFVNITTHRGTKKRGKIVDIVGSAIYIQTTNGIEGIRASTIKNLEK